MKRLASILPLILLMTGAPAAHAQSLISTLSLSPDQIGQVKTAQGITTRISFPDEIDEIICGDLYDPASGKGSFVAQRSGNDVFIKPIPSKGMSNLFVKTRSKRVYNFDLSIVANSLAHRVVNIIDPHPVTPPERVSRDPGTESGSGSATDTNEAAATRALEERKADLLQQAKQQAEEIVRAARQQAGRIIEEAQTRLTDADRQATARGEQEAERRFVQSLMLGLRDMRINNPRLALKKIIFQLEPRVMLFNEKAYLRYTIQNTGEDEFGFVALQLEAGADREMRAVAVELVQSKAANRLAPGEALTGVITFDGKLAAAKDRLAISVRGDQGAELARIAIR